MMLTIWNMAFMTHFGGHNARDQPEGEDDGTSLDAHAPLGLAVLLLERPQDGD